MEPQPKRNASVRRRRQPRSGMGPAEFIKPSRRTHRQRQWLWNAGRSAREGTFGELEVRVRSRQRLLGTTEHIDDSGRRLARCLCRARRLEREALNNKQKSLSYLSVQSPRTRVHLKDEKGSRIHEAKRGVGALRMKGVSCTRA